MNTRSTPREVEALQARAREYTRRQLEQMDEWERGFYREWTSLISWNALAFPYPMESESEAQALNATPTHGYTAATSDSSITRYRNVAVGPSCYRRNRLCLKHGYTRAGVT